MTGKDDAQERPEGRGAGQMSRAGAGAQASHLVVRRLVTRCWTVALDAPAVNEGGHPSGFAGLVERGVKAEPRGAPPPVEYGPGWQYATLVGPAGTLMRGYHREVDEHEAYREGYEAQEEAAGERARCAYEQIAGRALEVTLGRIEVHERTVPIREGESAKGALQRAVEEEDEWGQAGREVLDERSATFIAGLAAADGTWRAPARWAGIAHWRRDAVYDRPMGAEIEVFGAPGREAKAEKIALEAGAEDAHWREGDAGEMRWAE